MIRVREFLWVVLYHKARYFCLFTELWCIDYDNIISTSYVLLTITLHNKPCHYKVLSEDLCRILIRPGFISYQIQ